MSIEVQQLIDIITKMQASQDAANSRFDTHLSHLRDSMHDIKNDYHGQATMVKMIYKDVESIKERQEKDLVTVHARIDKHVKVLERDLSLASNKINEIAPMAIQFGKIYDNASKTLIGIFMAALIAAAAFFVTSKT